MFGSSKQKAVDDRQMFLRCIGKGESLEYELSSYATNQMVWVSEETDATGEPVFLRTPEEQTVQNWAKGPFTFAGKLYRNINHFINYDEDGQWATDVYGRRILCLKERFPCFDSFDFLHETRYYRWFFLREGNRLHRLFFTDEQKNVHITQDVRNLETKCWEKMQTLGYCQRSSADTP